MSDDKSWSPTMNLRWCTSQCGAYAFLHQQFTRDGASGPETVWRRIPMARDHDPNPDTSHPRCPHDVWPEDVQT